MNDTLKIALFQTDIVWENIDANLDQLDTKVANMSDDVELLIFPEMFATGFSMNPSQNFETMEGKVVKWMQNVSKKHQVATVGSVIIKEDHNFYNRLVFSHPSGELEYYDKRHLFTYGGEDKEYSQGNKRLILDYKGWKICPLICYDLRFPVWSRNDQDFDLLIFIANWPKPRISAWDTLLQARAIENMCYSIGVNRVGVDGNKLEYVGHSQVNDMLGKSLVKSIGKEDVIELVIDKTALKNAREKFRFLNDKDEFKIL